MQKQLINHFIFMRSVLDGHIILCNDMDATVFASWKVGGQDFYIYGRREPGAFPSVID